MSQIAEILLAQIWNSQWFRHPLRTPDGSVLRVIYPGVWTHGFGPDFRDAMLDINGELVTGDIEVELDVTGWVAHGHHLNDAFDNVILQVVGADADHGLVRRSNGGEVPRVVLTDFLNGPLDEFADHVDVRPLGAIGFDACAPEQARERPDLIRDVCQRAGDRRMQEKVAAMSGEMAISTPDQVLYARMLDALGFSRNREPMQDVAARLTAEQLWLNLNVPEPDVRFWRAAALLLGVGGFLPLSPRDAAVARLEPDQIGRVETLWHELGEPWRGIEVSPGAWSLARLRPAAHPVRRLLAGAAIYSGARSGLIEHLLSCLQADRPRQELNRWLAGENPYLGSGHAHELIVNVMVPFALAYGDEASQPSVSDAAAELWQELPAGRGNAVTRQTLAQICGDELIPIRTARAEQGLIHINRQGCSQMRCFECGIAHLVLRRESAKTGEAERL